MYFTVTAGSGKRELLSVRLFSFVLSAACCLSLLLSARLEAQSGGSGGLGIFTAFNSDSTFIEVVEE